MAVDGDLRPSPPADLLPLPGCLHDSILKRLYNRLYICIYIFQDISVFLFDKLLVLLSSRSERRTFTYLTKLNSRLPIQLKTDGHIIDSEIYLKCRKNLKIYTLQVSILFLGGSPLSTALLRSNESVSSSKAGLRLFLSKSKKYMTFSVL